MSILKVSLSNYFFDVYLRQKEFPKICVKVGVLFCPPGVVNVSLRYYQTSVILDEKSSQFRP